jgi:hypothetical protein
MRATFNTASSSAWGVARVSRSAAWAEPGGDWPCALHQFPEDRRFCLPGATWRPNGASSAARAWHLDSTRGRQARHPCVPAREPSRSRDVLKRASRDVRCRGLDAPRWKAIVWPNCAQPAMALARRGRRANRRGSKMVGCLEGRQRSWRMAPEGCRPKCRAR